MYILKWFRFIIAKIYNILWYVIARILRHMCNLHIKETEISQKRSKGIKNWKITYSVILSVLSNKTNLILGFSSPLKGSSAVSTSCAQNALWTQLMSDAKQENESLVLQVHKSGFSEDDFSLLNFLAPPSWNVTCYGWNARPLLV